ncbi:MAG: hypothetical protein H7321_09065, partial [Bacteroidia bacterium]|nr:hypothetical protein [Bacteroidia bacterium]
MRYLKISLAALFAFIAFDSFSQGPVLTSVKGNQALKSFDKSHPGFVFGKNQSRGIIRDTLKLPFFDEFVKAGPFPDPKKWTDNQAYVNATFALSPPSYGVATLDNLNSKGNPYNTLSGKTSSRSDSLTSQPINLKTRLAGMTTVKYTPADSVYLSFFYQSQGLGDLLDNSDTLILEFKDTFKKWSRVWAVTGTKTKPFKQILQGIIDGKYLGPDFQFRFVNYTKNTGNLNQWHLDYIRINRARNRHDTLVEDLAINK